MSKMNKIVHKNDGSINVHDILCTTYQMRNFYTQFRDGFFTGLDVMNYIQHFKAVKMMKKGQTVLDVCCGRGLLLPMIRYHARDIKKYIGVDIKKENIKADKVNICNNKPIDRSDYYDFETEWVISNVSEMASHINEKVDFIVYTSAIEHMHKVYGEQSLVECAKLIQNDGYMFISCPNTSEGQDGYEVRYKAHVYEWKLNELRNELKLNNFKIVKEYGLTGSKREFLKMLETESLDVKSFMNPMIEYMPTEFFTSFCFLPYPEISTEVLIIAQKTGTQSSLFNS